MGEGSYTIKIYRNISGTSYSEEAALSFKVNLKSMLSPYTASSIISDFSRGSACVQKAAALCAGQPSQTAKVDAVYRWIMNNIKYDRALADQITAGTVKTYLPNPNTTYSTRRGICFDYASLMCAMLRSQGIPTRLIKGQTPYGYHAWNEVYFAGVGWVVVADFKWKQIDGESWVLLDSTFAASGLTSQEIKQTSHVKMYTY
jgi:transglutaminase/protease-like cytokinesis protein 3